MKSVRSQLQGVTHEDLREWAGDKIYRRGKSYIPCVAQLSRTADGTLVAWVTGTDEYATWVRHDGQGHFDHDCTCPFDDWGPCKHAVAVVLAAGEQIKHNREIPLLDADDELYLEAFEDGEEDDFFDEEEDWEDGAQEQTPGGKAKGRSPQIEGMLAGKSRDELLALLIDLALDFPDVARRIRDAAQLATGQVDKIVRSLRREIRSLTSEEAWYNPWKQEGHLPDYSHVEQQLRALLEKGQADAVLSLEEELWERGNEQVAESHDEGDTALAISACLDIVLQALPRSSLKPAQQLLWLVNRHLEDEYGLLEETAGISEQAPYTEEDWREVAAALEARLQKMGVPRSGRFSETYDRERVMKWLRDAYRKSGQKEKVIPLLEKEADRCRSYETLVAALLDAGERDQARCWCIRGFDKTVAEAPGIASGLQTRLRELAEAEGKFDLAAAYRAEDFFERPSGKAFAELRRSAEKIDAWPTVRQGVLRYLETGRRPESGAEENAAWPLPRPEVKTPGSRKGAMPESFPNLTMLIEIALLEQRYDDAVALYETLAKVKRWGWSIDEQLAQAVSESHPQVSLRIWLSIAESLIGRVKPKAYREAAVYLRSMRKVYEKTGRIAEWKTLIGRLRVEHKAKRRLQEVLDGLEKDRKIVD